MQRSPVRHNYESNYHLNRNRQSNHPAVDSYTVHVKIQLNRTKRDITSVPVPVRSCALPPAQTQHPPQ